ncbi:hypothetical protein REH81_01525 [Vibrio rotiferianus]
MTEKIEIKILTADVVSKITKSQIFAVHNPRSDHDAVVHLCSKYIESLASLKKELKIGGTELVLLIQYELDVLLRAILHPSNDLSISDVIKILSLEVAATSSTLRTQFKDELETLLIESSCIVELQGDVLDKSRITLCQLVMSEGMPPEDATPLLKVAATSYFALYIMMQEMSKTN